jgi:ABC-type multidrug transport system fused ATPase/permease subunit
MKPDFLFILLFSDRFFRIRHRLPVAWGKVIQETITLGVLVAFLSYIRMFFQPIRDLSEKYNILQSAMASLERIFSLLDRDEKISEPLSGIKGETKGNIEFCDVSFSYDGEERVLKEVSFSVREGETVAIVGATGAGKTSRSLRAIL